MAQLLSGTRIYGTATIDTQVFINGNFAATNTTTGALQVIGGAVVGGNLFAGGTIYDSNDLTNQSFIKPTVSSQLTSVSVRGTELPSGSESNWGGMTVTRQGINASNTTTFYGLHNRSQSGGAPNPTVGIGLDSVGNLWFGKVGYYIPSANYQRTSNLFYSDLNGNLNATGNVFAGGSFRSRGSYYDASNTAFYLDLQTTLTNHTILATGVSTDLIGYNSAWGTYFGGTNFRWLSNGTTSTTGPLWINSGTVYPILTEFNSTLFQTSSTFTNPVLIKLNNSDNTGATSTTHLTLSNQSGQSTGIYWRFSNQFDVRASIRANDFGDIIYNSLSGNYKFQQDFGTYPISFSNSTTMFMSVDPGGNVTFPKNIYAAKLFDYNDNTYFVDPSSTSTMNQLTLKGLFNATVTGTSGTWTDVILATAAIGGTYISASRPSRTTEVGYKWMTGTATIWTNNLAVNDDYTLYWRLLGNNQYSMNSAGTLAAINPGASAMHAVTFADVNDARYYVKPASFSYINSLTLAGNSTIQPVGSGLRVFTPDTNSYYSTLFWNNWNWQTDAAGNAALWSNTTTRVATITPLGSWGINQSSIPTDITMYGGVSITGTGTTQISVVKGTTSGFSLRVSDVVFGDFALYDKAQGSWYRSIHSRQGKIGINTPANLGYGLTVDGGISTNNLTSSYDSAYTINFTGTSVLSTLNAVQYGWYLNTGTGVSSIAGNTFETAAVFGADHALGGGSLIDLLMWTFPTTTETFNQLASAWAADATSVNGLFNGQNSLNNIATTNYSLPAGVSKQRVRFTWNMFGIKTWDALLITALSGTTPLSVTIETSADGSTWVTHVNNVLLGTTAVPGLNYLRTQGTSTGNYFRLTIIGTGASIVNFYNISLLGTKGPASGWAQRLLNWDINKNISTYGNITTKIHYDAGNSNYYLSSPFTSVLNTLTTVGDVLTQGQGRFTGWQNAQSTSTRDVGNGVEIGVNSGAAAITAYDRTAAKNSNLGIYGNLIYITPVATGTVIVAGTQWVDASDPRYYVKPSTSTVLSNLQTWGAVQIVNSNTNATNYNYNLRLPRSIPGAGWSMISMATDLSGIGNIVGQWNLEVEPTSGNPTWLGRFNIRNGASAVAISIASATNTTTFAANVFAPKYLGSNDERFFVVPQSQSYLSALKVGGNGLAGPAWDVLTMGPLDQYSNTWSYVHTVLGMPTGLDTAKDFNVDTLSFMSYAGSFSANNNTPSDVGATWYTLHQAAHRGGLSSDGKDYSSQIAIPMTSVINSSRMFFRAKTNATWQSWQEVFTVGPTNIAKDYLIYAKTLYDSRDTRYNVTPSDTTTLNKLNTYGAIAGYLSGTPTTANSGSIGPPDTRVPSLPRLGSSEWVYPNTDGTAVKSYNSADIYREGLYTWWTNNSANGPTGSTNPYFAGVGFGGGGQGSAEIAAYWGAANGDFGDGLYFRTFVSAKWTKWTRILNSTKDTYAANLNQNLRTTDSPTFSTVTLTSFSIDRITAKSYWTNAWTAANGVRAHIVMPWRSVTGTGGAGGIGPYGSDNSNGEKMGFRFDSVSETPETNATLIGQQSYEARGDINIWVGPNRVIQESGDRINTNSVYSKADATYQLTPNGASYLSSATFTGGITLSGGNAAGGKIAFTSSRGIINVDYNNDSGTVPDWGTIATYGTGRGNNLGDWDGYVISAYSTYQSASFVKNHNSNIWGIRSTNGHWSILSSNNSSDRRMVLNAADLTKINAASGYSVYVYGSIYATDNVFAYSDRRKKRDVTTIENALDKVLKLRGVTYYRIDAEPENINRKETGVIAQEVDEVFPEVVKYSKSSDEYGVAYGNMAGIFIEAIKDLKKELDELKTELNMLKGNK